MTAIREIITNINNDDRTSRDRFGIPDKKSVILAEAMYGLVVSEELRYEDIGTDLPSGETLTKRMLDTALSRVHWRCLAFAVMERIAFDDAMAEESE